MTNTTTAARPLGAALALLLLLLAPPVAAQRDAKAPKAGKPYEDATNLGYELKAPHKWDVTPPGPEDANLQVKFTHPSGARVGVAYLLLFDSRVTKEVAQERRQIKWHPDVGAWITARNKNVTYEPEDLAGAPLKTKEKGLAALEHVWRVGGGTTNAFYYVATYPLDEHRDLHFVGKGPGGKAGKKWITAYRKMARSFERVKVEEIKGGKDARKLEGPRRTKYEALVRDLPSTGGWRIHVSDNYFVVSDVKEVGFIRKIQRRLEAIRKWYERDFPLEKAYVPKPKEPETPELPEGFEDLPPEEQERVREELEAEANRSRTDPMGGLSPQTRSRMCVVRVFKDRSAYLKYGAPQGSAGYWWPLTEELALYDNPDDREQSLGTLFHEAFHQYMYYYCGGEVQLHGWFNEGTADFYAGYVYLNGQIRAKEGDRRLRTIKGMVKSGSYAPLETLVTWYRDAYYGRNDLGQSIGQNYAQGWSLVNLLQRGSREKPRGWKKAWKQVIPTYLDVALETGDADRALEEAFGEVDFDDLQECWLHFLD